MSKTKLGDICKICSSKRVFESEYKTEGIPFIRGLEITNGSLLKEKTKYDCYISTDHYLKLKKEYGVPQKGDILITAVGTIGNLCYIDREKPFYFKDGNIIWFKNFKNNVYPKFLYYFMQSSYFKRQMKCALIGAVQKALTMVMLSEIEVDLPEYGKQVMIANILDSLEAKIQNNDKLNLEFESLAKTLYDYWFLQFEFPDEEGRPYKSSGGKTVWNEELKREIPEGWEIKQVKDCVKHINTGLNPRDNFTLNDGGDVKYITVKNLTANGTIDFSNCDLITKEVKDMINKRSMIAEGDILFASIAPLGRCFLMYENPKDWEINESVFSIRPNYDILNSEFLYMFFMSDWFIKKSEHASTGSVFNGIRISTLEDTKIMIPPEEVLNKFQKAIKPVLKAKFKNAKQNQQLSSLRDWLLPMLMNGQVTFED